MRRKYDKKRKGKVKMEERKKKNHEKTGLRHER